MKRFPLFIALILIAAACSPVVNVQPVKIEGAAMLPALKDGDRIIIDRNVDKIERGDIVIFYYPDAPTKSYLKRIVGLPNETVDIREGKVFINGTPLDEPYIDPQLNQSHRSMEARKLAADQYFVCGDNRDNSSDSRIWGPLGQKFIYGKYLRKYFSGF
jgi:signal peptidase I